MQRLDATQPSIRISTKVTQAMKNDIDALTKEDGSNASTLIRSLLDQWLAERLVPPPEKKGIFISKFEIWQTGFVENPTQEGREVMIRRGVDPDELLARYAAGER